MHNYFLTKFNLIKSVDNFTSQTQKIADFYSFLIKFSTSISSITANIPQSAFVHLSPWLCSTCKYVLTKDCRRAVELESEKIAYSGKKFLTVQNGDVIRYTIIR